MRQQQVASESPSDRLPVIAGGQAALHGDQDQVQDEIHRTLALLLPWVVSVFFHLALIVLALFLVWSLEQVVEDEMPLTARPTPMPIPMVPLESMDTPTDLEPRNPRRDAPDTTTREQPTPTSKPIDLPIVLLPPRPMPDPVTSPIDREQRKFIGVPTGRPGVRVERVAFVIDASGSLVDTFPFLLDELRRYIRGMDETQSFAVLFFQGDRVIEIPPPGMREASASARHQVMDWLDAGSRHVTPGRQGNPVAALQLALRYRPEVIFLVSDNITGQGTYSIGQTALLNAIARANVANTMISTIQFVYEDPMAHAPGADGKPLGEKGRTLYRIARMTGGHHGFVSASALNVR